MANPTVLCFDVQKQRIISARSDALSGTWNTVADTSTVVGTNAIITFSVVIISDTLYLLTWRKWLYKIKLSNPQPFWERLEDAIHGHGEKPAILAYGEKIYACGGGWEKEERCYADDWPMDKYSTASEVYETSNGAGSWKTIKDMLVKRRFNSLIEVDGGIYCVGGIGENSDKMETDTVKVEPGVTAMGRLQNPKGDVLHHVEMYNPITDTWKQKRSLITPRVKPGLANYKQNIFALGGARNWQKLQSIECYDIPSDSWLEIKFCEMRRGRASFGACVVQEEILIVGGEKNNPSIEKIKLSKLYANERFADDDHDIIEAFAGLEESPMATVFM